jgi:zinc transport system substrate-binding protein
MVGGGRWLGGVALLGAATAGLAGGAKPTVFVSILPQVEFVERVAGGRVRVEVMVQPGDNPHIFEPSPRQMAALAGAAAYFRIGVNFENALLPKLASTIKDLRVVDTRNGIQLRRMQGCGDPAHADDHDGDDPHIWTSPRLVKVQARTIADALVQLDPGGTADYERNYQAYAGELDALDARLAAVLAPAKGRTFMVYHPAWGYFADAYGLRQVAVEIEGKEPSARQLVRIIETARREGVKVIFVQPQFSRTGAEAVAEAIGGTVVPLDPLARNHLANLDQVAAAVSRTLAGQH